MPQSSTPSILRIPPHAAVSADSLAAHIAAINEWL